MEPLHQERGDAGHQKLHRWFAGFPGWQVFRLWAGYIATDIVVLQAWAARNPDRPNVANEAELGEAVHATRMNTCQYKYRFKQPRTLVTMVRCPALLPKASKRSRRKMQK